MPKIYQGLANSAKWSLMAGLGAFDQFMDFVEGGIDAITGTSRARPSAPATGAPHRSTGTTGTTGRIEILEVLDAVTGRPIYIVKFADGDTAECSSRARADQIKRALETT